MRLPKFCDVCGAALVWDQPTFSHFHGLSGKRVYNTKLICPNRKWWQIWHDDPYVAIPSPGPDERRYYRKTVQEK